MNGQLEPLKTDEKPPSLLFLFFYSPAFATQRWNPPSIARSAMFTRDRHCFDEAVAVTVIEEKHQI